MASSLQLPYFRDRERLPASLPTTAEILASKEILKGTEKWATRKVVGIGAHFVAKYSKSNDRIEGDNLLFLEKSNLLGFAPLLYAMWKEDDGTLFLVMERIQGATLESLWPAMEEVDKTSILAHVRSILTKVRATPHPGFFGSVDGNHLPYHLFFWPKYPKHVSGPFATEAALVQGLVSKSRLNAQENGRHSYQADFFEQQLISTLALEGRTPVLTHSDLQRKNIMVHRVETDDEKRKFQVSIVDWESAGWYPAYWEYFTAFQSLRWDDDWCNVIGEIVDSWPVELAMMKMIYQDLWM